MCKAVYECRKGFSKVIENLASTRIIEDRWGEGKSMKLKQGISLDRLNLINVKDLMSVETNNWNTSLVWRRFKPESANRILGTYITQDKDKEDELVWSRNKTGRISSKDAYSLLLSDCKTRENASISRKFWGHLWSMHIKPKWKIFI